MTFAVRFKPSVEKDLRPLPVAVRQRVLQCIQGLLDTPLPRGVIKLAGAEHLYRVRVGDYRVVYEIDRQAAEVVVHYVRHRREAYR